MLQRLNSAVRLIQRTTHGGSSNARIDIGVQPPARRLRQEEFVLRSVDYLNRDQVPISISLYVTHADGQPILGASNLSQCVGSDCDCRQSEQKKKTPRHNGISLH